MGVVDQDLRCIGHPKAMTEPAFAELSVLPACTWEEHIKTAYLVEAMFW